LPGKYSSFGMRHHCQVPPVFGTNKPTGKFYCQFISKFVCVAVRNFTLDTRLLNIFPCRVWSVSSNMEAAGSS
jgi:hypothetical protein